MNLISIIPFTGSDRLVSMTEDCIEQLLEAQLPPGVKLRIIAVNNAASRKLKLIDSTVHELEGDKNYGFGVGVNRGIDYAIYGENWPCDAFLIVNNDLKFPNRDWLSELIFRYEPPYVLSPRTDITATVEACHPSAEDKPPTRCREVSAFCWLVPMRVINAIIARWDWPLFCPQFTNYGSDDATAAILRSLYGETPFKVVNTSWVKHLKAQTANELHVKAGTEELLKELKAWKRAHKLK